MICEICTMDTLRGTMYRLKLPKFANLNVCSSCREAVISAERREVDELEEHERWYSTFVTTAPKSP